MSSSDRYESQAQLDFLRRRLTHPRNPDLAIHRRTIGLNSIKPASDSLHEYVAELLSPVPGTCLLDLGCGFGAAARYIGRTRRVHVTGITTSQRQIEVASGVETDSRIVTYRLQSFDQPIGGNYDGAFAIESLIHSKDLLQTMSHVANVLRPAARLVIVDDYWDSPTDAPKLDADTWGVTAFRSHQELLIAALSAGFEHANTFDLSDHVRRMSQPVRTILSRLPAPKEPGLGSWLAFWRTQATMHQMLAERQQRYIATLFIRT